MNEYISREELIKALEADYDCSWCSKPQGVEEYVEGARDEYDDVLKVVCGMKAADVQPINQWISVKDQLPKIGESVLIAVVVNAKLNIPFRTDFTPEIRIGWLEDDGEWGLQFDSADRDEILYWQPLPELPKDGDING